MEVNLETVPCVFQHYKHPVFYCRNHPQGMTMIMNQATRFVGAKQREAGLKEITTKYKEFKPGMLVFTYLVSA